MAVNDFYRGYLKTKGKDPIESYAREKVPDSALRTLDDACKCNEFAGVLADDAIVVDIDDMTRADIILKIVEAENLKCRVIKTTRGMHFLFKNKDVIKSDTHEPTAIGVIADTKCGKRNTVEILKFNGVERPIIRDIAPGETYDVIPKWLTIIPEKRGGLDLTGLADGDGRNDTLFKYILTLQRNKFTVEECRECIRIANKYVFKEPLDDKELEVILRDESFKVPELNFFDDKKFLVDAFAEYIKSTANVCCINNQLHIYHDGVYTLSYKEIEREMIKTIPGLKRTQRKEALDYLELIADEKEPADARYIAFNNGILDIVTGEIKGFSPDIVITNKIRWNYNPEAYKDITDNTLNKLAVQDPSIRALLEECIGYCFYRRSEIGASFVLTGDKSNGKSTFIHMLHAVLGDENICSLDISEMGDRFSTSMMFGKLANLGDDIGDDFLKGNQVSIFKKIVTGDRIKAERKGLDPFEFNPYVKLVFSANDIPRMRDKTGAVGRRLIIIPFEAKFSKNDPDYDPYIKYKLIERESIEYLIRIGVEGLRRVLEVNGFTKSEKVKKRIDEYEADNNPIIGFIDEIGVGKIKNHLTEDVYRSYTVYCTNNGMQPMAKIGFVKQVNTRLSTTVKTQRVGGVVVKYFKEI